MHWLFTYGDVLVSQLNLVWFMFEFVFTT